MVLLELPPRARSVLWQSLVEDLVPQQGQAVRLQGQADSSPPSVPLVLSVRRQRLTPRLNWPQQLEGLGFSFHTSTTGEPYWDESACYHFTSEEIDEIDKATANLHQLCLRAVDQIISKRQFESFALPDWLAEQVTNSWQSDEPTLYGRFDLGYDGTGAPKLLEYNADTPTSLVESAVAQWNWQQEVFPSHDQFNLLHEKLIARWQSLAKRFPELYFACVADHPEDQGNLDYLRDTALQASIDARSISIEDLGWSADDRSFKDLDGETIRALFKLYPWEWLAREEFGPHLAPSGMNVVEPAWKILLSCKSILPILWDIAPGHPNLLPCAFNENTAQIPYVKKPRYGREGANVELLNKRSADT